MLKDKDRRTPKVRISGNHVTFLIPKCGQMLAAVCLTNRLNFFLKTRHEPPHLDPNLHFRGFVVIGLVVSTFYQSGFVGYRSDDIHRLTNLFHQKRLLLRDRIRSSQSVLTDFKV